MRIPFTRTVQCPVCGGRGAAAADMRPCKICRYQGEVRCGYDRVLYLQSLSSVDETALLT